MKLYKENYSVQKYLEAEYNRRRYGNQVRTSEFLIRCYEELNLYNKICVIMVIFMFR